MDRDCRVVYDVRVRCGVVELLREKSQIMFDIYSANITIDLCCVVASVVGRRLLYGNKRPISLSYKIGLPKACGA